MAASVSEKRRQFLYARLAVHEILARPPYRQRTRRTDRPTEPRPPGPVCDRRQTPVRGCALDGSAPGGARPITRTWGPPR
jgi:hypothetical protein